MNMERYCHLFLLFLVTGSFSIGAKGQCVAETRNDTALCVFYGMQDTISLGGSPTATQGEPPYEYTWSCSKSIGTTQHLTASDFLDDTTAADPELVTALTGDSLQIYLEVTDVNGNTCRDTVTVEFCNFGVLLFHHNSIAIDPGDTAELETDVEGGFCEPLSYQWTPNYNISDPTAKEPEVWPDTSTTYSAVVTDSAGCETVDTFQVNMETAGIEERGLSPRDVSIHPNPMKERSTIRIEHPDPSGMRMEFYDASGRKVDELPIEGEETRFQRKGLESGMYFYRLFDEQKALEEGKLILR